MRESQDYLCAVEVLQQVIVDGHALSLPARASGLARQICYGVLRDYHRLCFLRDALVAKHLPTKHADINLLLLCGLYSLRSLARPDHASVNATVQSVVALKKPWAKGLVNGVLRNFQRRQQSLEEAADENSEALTCHPEWLTRAIKKSWPDDADDILTANNHPGPMTLRVNANRCSVSDYLELLAAEEMQAQTLPWLPNAVQLLIPVRIDALPGFSEGLVSVQDAASQLAGTLMDLEPGMNVLDACAAPGGKTCHLLELVDDLSLLAIDISEQRITMIRENLDRLGLVCETLSTDLNSFTERSFDRILLDVPCSATGVIRRHPDIKLLRQPDDIAKLSDTQSALLSHAWQLLNPGGILLYSTCSVLSPENEEVVYNFIESQADVVKLSINADRISGAKETALGLQLFPEQSGHDGFYYAKMMKAT